MRKPRRNLWKLEMKAPSTRSKNRLQRRRRVDSGSLELSAAAATVAATAPAARRRRRGRASGCERAAFDHFRKRDRRTAPQR